MSRIIFVISKERQRLRNLVAFVRNDMLNELFARPSIFKIFEMASRKKGSVFIASDLTPTPLAPWSDKIGEWIGESRILIFEIWAENLILQKAAMKKGT